MSPRIQFYIGNGKACDGKEYIGNYPRRGRSSACASGRSLDSGTRRLLHACRPVVARRQFRRKVPPRERGKWSSGPAAGSAASSAIVPEGMGFSIAIKGTFLSRRKGDIFIEGRQRVFQLSRTFWGVSEMLRASVITSKPATHDRPKSGQPDSRRGRLFQPLDERRYPYCPRSHRSDWPARTIRPSWNVVSIVEVSLRSMVYV